MKKPIKPNRPDRGKLDWRDDANLNCHYYADGKEEITLYSDSYFLFDNEFDYRCEECEDEGCEECESWNVPDDGHVGIGSLTLQDIIDKVPEGFTPSDVKMSFGCSLCQMGPSPSDCVSIRFVYRKHIDLQAELNRYAREKERYKIEMAEYEEAKKAYDTWKREQEIAKKQAELDELKAQK